MKIKMFKQKGFTLIELLVVVLIIGILAAIAVPQYQKAVDKARYSELMNLVKHIKNEQELFYLQNGKYAEDCKELGTETPSGTYLNNNNMFYFLGEGGDQWISCYHAGDGPEYARVAGITSRFGGAVSYEQMLDNNTVYPGAIRYYAGNSPRGEALVKSYCGDSAATQTGSSYNKTACTVGYEETLF